MFPGEVLLQGNRRSRPSCRERPQSQLKADGAEIVDGGRRDANAWPYRSACPPVVHGLTVPRCCRNWRYLPIEEHTASYRAARKALTRLRVPRVASPPLRRKSLGSTSLFETKSMRGLLPGPRLRAASPEITSVGRIGRRSSTAVQAITTAPRSIALRTGPTNCGASYE